VVVLVAADPADRRLRSFEDEIIAGDRPVVASADRADLIERKTVLRATPRPLL